jgi:hypothetical protein
MIRNDRIGHYIPPPTYKVPQPRSQVQQQTHGPPIEHYIPPPTYQVTQQNHRLLLYLWPWMYNLISRWRYRHAFVVVLVALVVEVV